jgi:predicted lysophospholipase L1 biosynthesis ABC-type transport system permease subunit
MGNLIKLVVMLIGGGIGLALFAGIYFGLAFFALEAMADNLAGGNEYSHSLGQKVGLVASIAGLCVGLLAAMAIASNRLTRPSGGRDWPVLVLGWVLVAPFVALVVFNGFGAAFAAVVAYKTVGILSVVLYGTIVGWIVRKVDKAA